MTTRLQIGLCLNLFGIKHLNGDKPNESAVKCGWVKFK
jgi:hypothetical protein